MPEQLTPRQQQILELIRQHTREHGYPPTVRWIGEQTGIKSPNGVTCHLKALVKKGWIAHAPGAHRGIRLVNGEDTPMDVLRAIVADPGFAALHESTQTAAIWLVQCASV